MPNVFAHTMFGAIVAIIFVAILDLPADYKILSGIIIVLFSLLPDLDHPKATARKAYRKFAKLIFSMFFLFLLLVFYKISFEIILLSLIFGFSFSVVFEYFIPKHRGVMHTFKFSILLSLFVYFLLSLFQAPFSLIFMLSVFIGYSSHLVLDRLF